MDIPNSKDVFTEGQLGNDVSSICACLGGKKSAQKLGNVGLWDLDTIYST